VAIVVEPAGQAPEKGLKTGALGLISSIVIGVASTAPAYSLAATLGFVVAAIGLQAPIVTILAFVPMLLVSIGYSEMNKADPDCGTTFTWATRAFGPRVGWMGGWGIVAADILVMASLAQIAGQYVFDLFNTTSIGDDPTSGWVLLVGVLWIVFMTWICYVGIEISANFQKALLSIELTMLTIMSIWALIRVGNGSAPIGHLGVSASWFNPFAVKHFSDFVVGLADMLFIYWGWDTAVSVNEETANAEVTPGKAAIASTFVLLGIYALVILAVQSFAGIGTTGIGLGNPANVGDVLSILGPAIFGHSTLASILDHLLLLMVLSSAAASTQTTILPTARTTLSMAVYKSIPSSFAKMHKRHLTPTVSTVTMGAVSIVLYVVMNYLSAGAVISDSVDSLGVMIAFYYGLTGFSCAWYYRKSLTSSVRNVFMQGVLPTIGGVILWLILGWSFWYYWQPVNSYTHWGIFGRQIGGVFILDVGMLLLGVILMFTMESFRPAFFRGETLTRDSATLVTEESLAQRAESE
jgi:amino acid transporter